MLVLLTLLAGTILADAPPPPEALPEPQSSGDRRVGPFTRDTYPSEVMSRPLTLPAGMFRAVAELDEGWFRLNTVSWDTTLGVAAAYGLTDQLEVGAGAAFGLAPLLSVRQVSLSGALLFHDGPAFDIALAAGLILDPSAAGLTSGISIGFPGRLLFADRLFLTFGGQLLTVTLNPFFPAAALHLGVGAQVTPSLALSAETDALKIVRQAVIPLNLSATLAVAKGFDVQARVSVYHLANPRLTGVFSLAGSAYF